MLKEICQGRLSEFVIEVHETMVKRTKKKKKARRRRRRPKKRPLPTTPTKVTKSRVLWHKGAAKKAIEAAEKEYWMKEMQLDVEAAIEHWTDRKISIKKNELLKEIADKYLKKFGGNGARTLEKRISKQL